ncbi:MAG: benzoate-CoA ligase family protein [Vicinamibacteria bacterium]
MDFPERFNMAWYFLDRNLEEGRGGKTCLRWRDESCTYAEVQARSNRFANVLRRLDVAVEDRVLIVLPDRPEFVFAWFGAAKAGAVIAMVNPIVPADDFVHYFEYTRARVAVVDAATLDRIGPLRASFRHLRHLIVVGGDAGPHLAWDEVIAREPDAFTNADTHRDDPAIWLFTSGSTGKPKAAVHLQQDLPWNTERYAKQVLGIGPDDVTVSVPKLFFGYATGTNLLFPFAVGGEAALFSERSEPATLFDAIERYRPTILTSVPTMINAMLNHPGGTERDLSSLRYVLSAGEALPPELYRRWKETFGVEILDGIGSAEMFHIYISNAPGDVTPGSLGRIVPGYEARIVDADGRDCGDDEAGTLWIKGESAAVLYWQAHEKSKEVLRGDWVVTGDHLRRDADGRYWYEGRTDDMLKVGGIFVSPFEVENCILEHPLVAECAVIGYKDDEGLIKPKAFVVCRGEPEAGFGRELQEFVKRRLAPFKYPRVVEIVEALPKNDRGKIDRKRLR